MAGVVEICNMALANIGVEGRIASLEENSEPARLCKLYFETVRRDVLSAHAWNFATRKRNLSLTGGQNRLGWQYAYAYPTDCLRAVRILQADRNADPVRFKVGVSDNLLEKIILTDEPNAQLEYVVNLTNVELFDPQATYMMTWGLSDAIATPLTQDDRRAQFANQKYTALKEAAKANDSSEGAPDENPQTEWDKAKLS